MSMLESGEKEKQELMDEMQSMTDLNNMMKEELDKKNAYLKNFAEGLETVKSNVEQERKRNEGISTHMETLNKQLEIKDSENEKLLAFADISKQTVDQMEKKIKLLEETLENRTNETGHLYKKLNCLEAESEEKDKLIQYLEKMTKGQLEQIKEFDKDLSIVQQLKGDLDKYNLQLNSLVTELSTKTDENEKLKQANIEIGMKLEMFKQNAREMQEQLHTELDYKQMYNDLKSKVDDYTASNKKTHSDSPLRTIDEQKDNIYLRESNLKIHSELNDMKEQN